MLENTLDEMKDDSLAAKLIAFLIRRSLLKNGADKNSAEYRMAVSTMLDSPLRTLKIFAARESLPVEALLELINGHGLRALRVLLGNRAEQ